MVIKMRKIYVFVAVVSLLLVSGIFAVPKSTREVSGEAHISLPVVMYHQITKNISRAGPYCITLNQLESDLKYIREKGYETVDVEQLLAYVKSGAALPEKPIMLTFDDGYETVYSFLLPLLEKYDMCAVASVVGAYADMYTEINDHTLSYSYMTWDEIAELAAGDRIEIQNHSYDLHKTDSSGRSGAQKVSGESVQEYSAFLNADIGSMQTLLEEKTGKRPTAFAYPFGSYSKESKQVLKAMGFEAAFICEERMNFIDTDDTEWLYRIGRYNRPHGMSSAEFFEKMGV